MRKIALMVLGAASGASLLLFFAVRGSNGYYQPHPYGAAAWLAAILAMGVCITMAVEFYLHHRLIHLYLGSTFLALTITGIWDALTLPASMSSAGIAPKYLALWNLEWLTLALVLIVGVGANRYANPKRTLIHIAEGLAAGILWSSLLIFLVYVTPVASGILVGSSVAKGLAVGAVAVFALAIVIYSRLTFHRNNAVLSWLAYGLIFAALAETAGMFVNSDSHGLLFGFASLMKVLAYLSPLAGTLAEQFRMQERLHEQASDLNTLMQAQDAVASTATADDLYLRIVELAADSLSGSGACLMPFDESRGLLHCAASVGFNCDAVEKQFVFRPSEGGPGSAYYGREVVSVRSLSDDVILSRKLEGVSGIRSAVFAPLVVSDNCLGVLGVFFDTYARLQKDQLRMLDALATQAALAVDGAKSGRVSAGSALSCADQASEMDIVWEIGQAVASKLDLQALVDTLAEKLKIATAAKACRVLVFDPDEQGMRILGHKALVRRHSVADHIDRCDMLSVEVAKGNRPISVANLQNSCNCKFPELVADEGTHHLLSVPMNLRGFLGAISLFRQNGEPFGEKEKRLLLRLAPLVATGIQNAEIYEREKRIAETLQKSFLPDITVDPPGYE
ncbi:MAG TPA: GAF domain-containing protein, partial [Armatimonadota bacterium]